MSENLAVTRFREYLKIKTVQPNPDYATCIKWLEKQAVEIEGCSFHVIECVPGKPIALFTIKGQDETLPSILLNSHTDVVPVFPEHWDYNPFSAYKDGDGNIFARGTQDMKCVGSQYLEAMRSLKKEGVQLLRTVHMTFVPDEEIDGTDGMKKFVKTQNFKNLNVGFALDEGIASETEKFSLFYGERNIWSVWITCPGSPGHGSQFIENNAGKKLQSILNSFFKFRNEQEQRLKDDPHLRLGDVITVNLTMLKGGVQFNVLPAELLVGFDVRVPPSTDMEALEGMIKQWCQDAGEDVKFNFKYQSKITAMSCVEDGRSVWWDTFSAACIKEGIEIEKKIFPAATDCRYVRDCGIEAFGFSPMNHTPVLLHDHNEFLNEKTFLRGIEIYKTIITHIANVP